MIPAIRMMSARMRFTGYECALHFHTSWLCLCCSPCLECFSLLAHLANLYSQQLSSNAHSSNLTTRENKPQTMNYWLNLSKQHRTVTGSLSSLHVGCLMFSFSQHAVHRLLMTPSFLSGSPPTVSCGLGSDDTPHPQVYYAIHLPGHSDWP